jgi:hypothetical protein
VNDTWINKSSFFFISNILMNIFKQRIRKHLTCNNIIIPNGYKWKYINLNPISPSMTGLIKIHKQDTNWRQVYGWVERCTSEWVSNLPCSIIVLSIVNRKYSTVITVFKSDKPKHTYNGAKFNQNITQHNSVSYITVTKPDCLKIM